MKKYQCNKPDLDKLDKWENIYFLKVQKLKSK